MRSKKGEGRDKAEEKEESPKKGWKLDKIRNGRKSMDR